MSDWTTKPRTPQPGDWTPKQIETLRSLAGKESTAEIAAAVGHTVGATSVKASQLNISLAYAHTQQSWTAREIATMRRLSRTHTTHEAAAALGRPRRSIKSKALREGISFAKDGAAHWAAKHSREVVERIAAMRAQGHGARHIGRELGIPESSVRNIITYRVRWREFLAAQQGD